VVLRPGDRRRRRVQPFVRLALARWQPNSLPGVELSGVVLAEFAQLAPDRGMTVVRDANDRGTLDLSVTGRTYDEGPGPVPADEVSALRGSVRRRRRRAPARRDRPPRRLDRRERRSRRHDLPDAAAFEDAVRWSGRVHVDPARGPYRVVVREFESFAVDAGGGSGRARRLVFAETIEV
jgi:hypothetical protein